MRAANALTPRQRGALWQLAAADEPVKSKFVSILTGSPGETIQAAPGFAEISRALGLLWPSAAEAENLVDAAVGGLQLNQGDRRFASVVFQFPGT